MYEVPKEQMKCIMSLFKGWEETLIWSCLEGYMGKAWTNNLGKPQVALIIIGDFAFLAGNSDLVQTETLVKVIQEKGKKPHLLLIPQDKKWGDWIEKVYGEKVEQTMRYATKKEPHVFDKKKLESFVKLLPRGFELKPIEKELYEKVQKEEWCQDLCSQFPTYQEYEQLGIGFCILHEGKVVSGASSYTVYSRGIEIEIDTHEAYRKKGLATVCAAQLILACLEKGLYPSWDAASKISISLAEKLGYHLAYEYTTYILNQ